MPKHIGSNKQQNLQEIFRPFCPWCNIP